MELYVRINPDNSVVSVSNWQELETIPVECDSGLVKMDRIDGYKIEPNDKGGNSLVYDENAYLEAKEKKNIAEAKTKAEDLYQELSRKMVLKSATDKEALVLKPLYPLYDKTAEYEFGERCVKDGKLSFLNSAMKWISLEG